MILKSIKLKDYYNVGGNPILESYCPSVVDEPHKKDLRPCVLVCPGGAYVFCSDRESENIALQFTARNFGAFVLKYSVDDFHYPTPIDEALAAIAYIRTHYMEYHIDPNNIFILGFSAGGHLAASAALMSLNNEFEELIKAKREDFKVNGLLLGYPCIDMHEFVKYDSMAKVCKNKNNVVDPSLVDKLSIQKHITKDFPHTFIWLTSDDGIVSPDNSLLLASALCKEKIPCELHMYPYGDHGLGTARDDVNDPDVVIKARASSWIDHAIDFIISEAKLNNL